jgi:hypothetical protein
MWMKRRSPLDRAGGYDGAAGAAPDGFAAVALVRTVEEGEIVQAILGRADIPSRLSPDELRPPAGRNALDGILVLVPCKYAADARRTLREGPETPVDFEFGDDSSLD